jgi:hypothetical protein
MADLATLDEVTDRLEDALDADGERVARAALEDASDLARYYAGIDWADADSAPRIVRTFVLRAVVRLMKNFEGNTQSRAGDETLAWAGGNPDEAGVVKFTSSEIAQLRALGGQQAPTLQTSGMSAWGTSRTRRLNAKYRHRRLSEECEPYLTGYDPYAALDTGYSPVAGSTEKPFPFFADDEGSV